MGCEHNPNTRQAGHRPVFSFAGHTLSEIHTPREEGRQELKAYFSALLDHQGATWIDAVGWSMFPHFMPGNRLRIVSARKPLRIGQVVLLIFGNRAIAHRLVAWNEEKARWIIKGDSQHWLDPLESEDDLIGVVDLVSRSGRIRPMPSGPELANLSYRLCEIWEDKLSFFPRVVKHASYVVAYISCLIWLRCAFGARPEP